MSHLSKLGEVIRKERREKDVSQEAMALILKVSRRTYQRIEKTGSFKLVQLEKVCSALGLEIEITKRLL